jgi:murein DD-endopeptidase MepM/ murein hydrolase activator NlpD
VEGFALSVELSVRIGELGRPWHLAIDRSQMRWAVACGAILCAVSLVLVYEIFASAKIYPQTLYQSRKAVSDQATLARLREESQKVQREVAAMDLIRDRVAGRFGYSDAAAARGPNTLSDSRLLETLFPDPEGNEAWSRSVEDLGEHAQASRASLAQAADLATKRMAQLEQTPSIVPARGAYSSGFGWRLHPILGEYMMHEGQDISGPVGLPVMATAAGRVVEEEFSSSFGNYVVLAHGGGVRTLYAHLSAFRCQLGRSVRRGEVIGLLGNTGRSTGPHVHYEVHVDGKPVDPLPWILPTTLVP